MGRSPQSRFIVSWTLSFRPSAWARAVAVLPITNPPAATTPRAPSAPSAVRRVIWQSSVIRPLSRSATREDSEKTLCARRLPPTTSGLSGAVQPVGGRVRLERPRQPQGTPQVARAGRRAREGQPFAIDLERAVRVHEHVAVAIVGVWLRHGHLLVPAVLAADRVGLDREREVLVAARLFPPDTRGIGIIAAKRAWPVDLPHAPFTGLGLREIDERRGPALAAGVLAQAPPSEVVRARDHARPHRLRDPHPVDEVPDTGLDLEQVAGRDPHSRRVGGMYPQRIRVGDLVEPLGVARARVDERRQPERGQEHHLALRAIEIRPVDVAADIVGHRLFRPLPRLERPREELELPRRRRKSDVSPAVDLDADRLTTLLHEPGDRIHRRAVEILGGARLLVGAVHLVLDQERAVLPHVLERAESLASRRLGQPGHAVLEDPTVQLLDAELFARAVRRLEVLPHAERAVGIDPPRELDPELVLFPDLAQSRRLVRLPGEVEALARLLERHAEHGLPEADPRSEEHTSELQSL